MKKYGNHLAVDHLSFTVEKGQVLGFLGPNGAGKSTTMNMITGYISATEGTIVIDGHDMFHEPEEAKKRIGYLPEIPPLYQDMTVLEYLYFIADLKLVKKSERIDMVYKALELTRIEDVAGRLIKHLSKGYKQRVGLAQAIIGFPDVLILDEPTVGLDPMQIIEIRDLIKTLSKNHTIILSSHILSEISAICDQVMIINHGKLIVSDSPENLEKHMNSSREIHLKIKGSKDVVVSALESIEGLTNLVVKEDSLDSDKDLIHIIAYCGEGIDIREAIFYELSERKCPIYEMHSQKMSLEDIFLELTQSREEDDSEDMDQNRIQEREGQKEIEEKLENKKNEREDAIDDRNV